MELSTHNSAGRTPGQNWFINHTTHYKYILQKQIPNIMMSGGAETITRSSPIASGPTTVCMRLLLITRPRPKAKAES